MLRTKRLVTGLLAVVLLAHTALAQVQEQDDAEVVRSGEKQSEKSAVEDRPQIAAAIVERTNEFREQKGRSPVEVDPELTEAARYFARYMASTNRYGHTADGQRPSQRAKSHGYTYCIVSENIAYQFSSAGFEDQQLVQRFMEGWKTSPGHRKNMLDRDVTQTGVAVAQSEETGYIYAVQMFGRPKSASISFQVANRSEKEVEYQIGKRSYPLPPRYTRTHERCRPAEMTVTWQANDEQRSKSFQPRNGDEFIIAGGQDGLQIKRQSSDAAAQRSSGG